MIHECAVPGCGTSIVAGMLMCRVHWFQVTPKTRAWVNHAWRDASSPVAESIRRLEHIREYRAAKERAIAEVARKQEETAQ